MDEKPHQPNEADRREQGFRSSDTLLNTLQITLPELVGQPTFSGSVSELVQETDTGSSLSSYPVSELLTSLRLRTIESETVLSEEDRRMLSKERILE